MDFVTSDSRNPFSFVEYAKSYLNFVNLIDEQSPRQMLIKSQDYIEQYDISGTRHIISAFNASFDFGWLKSSPRWVSEVWTILRVCRGI